MAAGVLHGDVDVKVCKEERVFLTVFEKICYELDYL